MTALTTTAASPYQRRVDAADWAAITAGLDDLGCALTPRLLTAADASELIGLYDRDEAFRSTITMGRHRFGEGEYRYLADPLPHAVGQDVHARRGRRQAPCQRREGDNRRPPGHQDLRAP
jgi:uncharacterized protein